MKRGIITLLFMIITLLTMAVPSAAEEVVEYKAGYGDVFGEENWVYYQVDVQSTDYLTVFAVYGFQNRNDYLNYNFYCSDSYSDNSSNKTWNRRYAYTLCDSNKKSIDPVGWHKPGKSNYRYGYLLSKGTYFIRVNTGKKKCGYYNIRCFLMSDRTGSAVGAYDNEGGTSKRKAKKIKSPDKVGFSSPSQILYYAWHGNYISFPMMTSGKTGAAWYKYYSDGKKPIYAVVRLGHKNGKWDMVVYGPSYPKGRVVQLPDKSVTDNAGSNHFYKGGKEVRWGNNVTLARSMGGQIVGPKKGWYYFKIQKRKTAGMKNEDYRKISFCGDIYITKKSSLAF